jgi:hypothetical protein
LKFTDPRIKDGAAFAKAVAKRIEKAGAGFDMGAYRDAPPGLRIWCGSTVESADVAALLRSRPLAVRHVGSMLRVVAFWLPCRNAG